VRVLAVVLVSLVAVTLQAATLGVVGVKTTDVAADVQAIGKGSALLKSKGSPAVVRVWRAQYAGDKAGSIVVSVEFPDFEVLAK
jgi:hypothetical protein